MLSNDLLSCKNNKSANLKKTLNDEKIFYLFLTLAIVTLSACSDDDQSSLNFNSIKGRAVIKGKVTYEPGFQKGAADNELILQKVAAAGAVVTVEVANSEYLSGSEGTKSYEVTADENGEYSVEVPVGLKSINAKVTVKEFKGVSVSFVNSVLLTVEGVKYETANGGTSVTLSDGNTKTTNISLSQMAKEKQDIIATRNLKAMVKGRIMVPAEDFIYGYNNEITGIQRGSKALANAKFSLRFTNSSDDNRAFRYDITTSANGEFAFTADLFDNWEMNQTKVRVEVPAFSGKMTHYYCNYGESNNFWGNQEINVYYNPTYSESVRLTEKNSAVAYDIEDVLVSDFAVTSDKKQIKGIGMREADYDEDGNRLYYTKDPWNLSNK